MKFYIQGDKSKAICPHCGLVSTTFSYRDLTLKESNKVVKNILVGVCDNCDATVSTPAQSTAEINRVREKEVVSIEASLPSVFIEILNLACFKLDPLASQDMIKRLLFTYIHKNASGDENFKIESYMKNYDLFLKSLPLITTPKKRLSMKVSVNMAKEFDSLTTALEKNKTDTIKLLVASIKKDIIDDENPKKIEELRSMHFISSC